MMQYKGYKASVQFDAEAKLLHGEVLGLRDVVTFQADSVSELEEAFHDSVDDYLEFCKERGEEPERPYSGKFLVRLDPSLHRDIDMAAAAAGQSVNAWVAQVLSMASCGRVSDDANIRSTQPDVLVGYKESVMAISPKTTGGGQRTLAGRGSGEMIIRRSQSGGFKEAAVFGRGLSGGRQKSLRKTTKK